MVDRDYHHIAFACQAFAIGGWQFNRRARGETAAEIQYSFDTLTLAEVHAAIAYYLHNKAEVDEYLELGRLEYEKRRLEDRAKGIPRITREMLLARKNGTDPHWKK